MINQQRETSTPDLSCNISIPTSNTSPLGNSCFYVLDENTHKFEYNNPNTHPKHLCQVRLTEGTNVLGPKRNSFLPKVDQSSLALK